MPPKTLSLVDQQRALIKQLDSAVKNHGKTGSARRTEGYFVSSLEATSNLFNDIKRLHLQIIASDPEEVEEYLSLEYYDQAEETFIAFKGELLDAQRILLPRPLPPAPPAQPLNPPPPNPIDNHDHQNEFRLPTINIPTFCGDYSSWPSYKNSFQHLVANNQTLSNLQRLHYLKDSLSGEAKKLVQNYDIVEANYAAAWDKLLLRYDNKRLLIKNHLKTLLHQPSQSKETAAHLRLLIDTTTDSMNGLRTLKIETTNWDPIIIHTILENLPIETHSLWESSQANIEDMPTLAQLLRFLENRFRTLEAIAEKPSRGNSNPFDKQAAIDRQFKKHTFSHVASTMPLCILCSQHHYLRLCPSFLNMSPKERRKFVQDRNTCTNCLTPGHLDTNLSQ